MGIKQLYNDNLRKLPNEYGDVSVMKIKLHPSRPSVLVYTYSIYCISFCKGAKH